MDPVGYGRFAAVARTGRDNRSEDDVFVSPKASYFPHLTQETVCSRVPSVGIPTAPDAKKLEKSTIYYLTLWGGTISGYVDRNR